MKTLVIFAIVWCCAFSLQAQVTQLDEARVKASPIMLAETSTPDEFRYIVKDGYAADFTKDPLAFVKQNFDIHSFIATVKDRNYDSYLVSFSTSKGTLQANYSKEGELERTSQKFTNVFLPEAVRNELFRQTKGWSMVKNTYTASGNGDLKEKESYRIKVKNGNKSKIVKINPQQLQEGRMAGI